MGPGRDLIFKPRAWARMWWLVLAPTGAAVDVAVRGGAGDTGLTIAKGVESLRDETLRLNHHTVVVVDEAAMVGTDELHQLLTATTTASCKTVLVGDPHQLAPVKARGGMFAQLCSDFLICRGHGGSRRCGAWVTPTSARRLWRCGMGPGPGAPRRALVCGPRLAAHRR